MDLNKIAPKVLGCVPVYGMVSDINKQRVKARLSSTMVGAIPKVAGNVIKTSSPSNATQGFQVKSWNNILYHSMSGAHTHATGYTPKGNHTIKNGMSVGNQNGWVKTSSGWKYRKNGQCVTGWELIDGNWYYFDTNEYMCTGCRMIKDNRYYFKTKEDAAKQGDRNAYGYMWTGWREIGGKRY